MNLDMPPSAPCTVSAPIATALTVIALHRAVSLAHCNLKLNINRIGICRFAVVCRGSLLPLVMCLCL